MAMQNTQQLQSIAQELMNLQMKVQSLLMQEKHKTSPTVWQKTAGSLSSKKAKAMLEYIKQSRTVSAHRLERNRL